MRQLEWKKPTKDGGVERALGAACYSLVCKFEFFSEFSLMFVCNQFGYDFRLVSSLNPWCLEYFGSIEVYKELMVSQVSLKQVVTHMEHLGVPYAAKGYLERLKRFLKVVDRGRMFLHQTWFPTRISKLATMRDANLAQTTAAHKGTTAELDVLGISYHSYVPFTVYKLESAAAI